MIRRLSLVMLLALGLAGPALPALTRSAEPGTGGYVIRVSGVSRDGPVPTPTATPVPPVPPGLAACYAPRPVESGGFVLQPAGTRSVFQSCQVVGYYGYPGVPGLGVLAQSEPAEMIERLRSQAQAYDDTNGPRGVIPAFHLIAAVAQADPGPEGAHLGYMPESLIREWIALAETYNALVILDLQMGTASVDAVVPDFLGYLQDPRVHLAVNPEWAMPPGVRPGTIIGWMDGGEINRVQELMSDYLAENGLLDRMLLVHQFTDGMIRDKGAIVPYSGVNLVIDTDGFGYASQKIGNYNRYIRDDAAPHGGMKLFYRRDIDLMTPAEVNELVPQPDFVTFE